MGAAYAAEAFRQILHWKELRYSEDREAVRLSDTDKKLFTWFAQNLDDADKRAEYQRALDVDVDINELERVIRGK